MSSSMHAYQNRADQLQTELFQKDYRALQTCEPRWQRQRRVELPQVFGEERSLPKSAARRLHGVLEQPVRRESGSDVESSYRGSDQNIHNRKELNHKQISPI